MESAPIENNKNDVSAEIMGILSQVMAMGANDSEMATLMGIQDAYQKKLISAEEAIERAEGVRDSKNAYH